jgi:hypothetical protein
MQTECIGGQWSCRRGLVIDGWRRDAPLLCMICPQRHPGIMQGSACVNATCQLPATAWQCGSAGTGAPPACCDLTASKCCPALARQGHARGQQRGSAEGLRPTWSANAISVEPSASAKSIIEPAIDGPPRSSPSPCQRAVLGMPEGVLAGCLCGCLMRSPSFQVHSPSALWPEQRGPRFATWPAAPSSCLPIAGL